MIKDYIKYLTLALLSIISIISNNIYAETNPESDPKQSTPLAPSEFQKNGKIITILESGVQDYIKNQEEEALNYGLHLNFNGEIISNPEIQFITDYSRISCNGSSLEANLPECSNIAGEYATLRPSNIFKYVNYKDQVNLSISNGVIHSLINPFPNPQLNTLLQNKNSAADSKNQKQIANLIAAQVPIMMAKNSLHGMVARRYVDPDTQSKLPSNTKPQSIMELMHDESLRRLIDPEWFTNLNKLPTNQLLMELLQLEAFKVWIEYNKFQQNERIEALLATLLSSQAGQANALSGLLDQDTKNAMKDSQEQMNKIKSALPNQ